MTDNNLDENRKFVRASVSVMRFLDSCERESPNSTYGGSTITEAVDNYLLINRLTRERMQQILDAPQ